uniref:Tubulin epsilon 1 n=1 Tax=Oncorhynchus kisutch TaxID=8019 RepID=A0A8C7DBX9_ONCKI
MNLRLTKHLLSNPLGHVFRTDRTMCKPHSFICRAVGRWMFGSAYREQIVDQLKRAAEHCDWLQCFLIHSMVGGEDSDIMCCVLCCDGQVLGYCVLKLDVITSSYNMIYFLCPFLLFFFQSLVGIVNKIKHMPHSGKVGSVIKKDTAIVSGQGGVSGAENAMNNVVANLLLNITSSARFEGSLNMDLNDMDLVPFPRLYYLVPSVTPLYTLADVNFPTRRSALLSQQLFLPHDIKHSLYILVSKVESHTPYLFSLLLHLRLRPTLPFVSWNQEGWKTGLCSMPPVDHSLLALTSNTCVKPTFIEKKVHPNLIFNHNNLKLCCKRSAHLHHYLFVDRMMEQGCFTGPNSSLSSVIEDYSQLDATKDRLMPDAARLNIAT